MRNFMKLLLLIIILIAVVVPAVAQQDSERDTYTPNSTEFAAKTFTYRHIEGYNHFSLSHTLEILWTGSAPASTTMTIAGVMRGGTSTTLVTSTSVSTSLVLQFYGVYDFYDIAITWTGAGPTAVKWNLTGSAQPNSPQVTGSVASSASATGVNPVLVGGVTGLGAASTLAVNSNGVISTTSSFTTAEGMSNVSGRPAYDVAGAGSNAPLLVYGAVFNGATWDRQFYCPNTTSVSVANTTTQSVALSGSTKIRVCSFVLSGNATAGSFELVYGTGANCVTGLTTLSGIINVLGATAAPVSFSGGLAGPLITPAAQALCVRATTTTATGFITWAQY